jgi:hypothetical protein
MHASASGASTCFGRERGRTGDFVSEISSRIVAPHRLEIAQRIVPAIVDFMKEADSAASHARLRKRLPLAEACEAGRFGAR